MVCHLLVISFLLGLFGDIQRLESIYMCVVLRVCDKAGGLLCCDDAIEGVIAIAIRLVGAFNPAFHPTKTAYVQAL